jgi:septal ring factor EnvC (AmiA/AmiB activator)
VTQSTTITVEIAPGELVDKITILEIKSERITDSAKLENVRVELTTLAAARDGAVAASPQLADLTAQLKAINEQLWDIEDDIRDCEREKDFGDRFIELARSVYKSNDQRAARKRDINELLGSRLIEEKSYSDYE